MIFCRQLSAVTSSHSDIFWSLNTFPLDWILDLEFKATITQMTSNSAARCKPFLVPSYVSDVKPIFESHYSDFTLPSSVEFSQFPPELLFFVLLFFFLNLTNFLVGLPATDCIKLSSPMPLLFRNLDPIQSRFSLWRLLNIPTRPFLSSKKYFCVQTVLKIDLGRFLDMSILGVTRPEWI